MSHNATRSAFILIGSINYTTIGFFSEGFSCSVIESDNWREVCFRSRMMISHEQFFLIQGWVNLSSIMHWGLGLPGYKGAKYIIFCANSTVGF